MNILLVSISAPPKNSPESLQTGRYIKYLSQQHKVTLLTTTVVGGWEPQDDGIAKYLKNVHQYIALWSLHPRLIWLLKKIIPSVLIPDEAFFFFWQVKRAIRKIKIKPDVIVSRSAPFSSAIMALKLSEHWQTPWLMHLSDLWVDSPFTSLNDTTRKKHLIMENMCINRAHTITLTSLKVIEFYTKKYPQLASKFQFLPNVFDDDDLHTKPISFNGKMQINFTGRLYGTRSIHIFLDCLENAIQQYPELENSIEVNIAGFLDNENVHRMETSPLKCVKYLGALPYDGAVTLQRNAHLLLLIDSLDDDSRYEMFFPSKLLDYLIAQRFVLAFTKKNSTSFDVVENKFGICFYPDNLNEFPAFLFFAVQNFLKRNSDFFNKQLDKNSEYATSYNAQRLHKMIEAATNPKHRE